MPKSDVRIAVVAGSTAWGCPPPVHFQWPTQAMRENGKLSGEAFPHMKEIRGVHGRDPRSRVHQWKTHACTLGTNKAGGMDEEAFEDCIRTTIMPLCEDAADAPGSRAITKLDSGPGRCNERLLIDLRHRGFCVFPSPPSATHVLQEADQSHGPFKRLFRNDLAKMAEDRMTHRKSINTNPNLV